MATRESYGSRAGKFLREFGREIPGMAYRVAGAPGAFLGGMITPQDSDEERLRFRAQRFANQRTRFISGKSPSATDQRTGGLTEDVARMDTRGNAEVEKARAWTAQPFMGPPAPPPLARGQYFAYSTDPVTGKQVGPTVSNIPDRFGDAVLPGNREDTQPGTAANPIDRGFLGPRGAYGGVIQATPEQIATAKRNSELLRMRWTPMTKNQRAAYMEAERRRADLPAARAHELDIANVPVRVAEATGKATVQAAMQTTIASAMTGDVKAAQDMAQHMASINQLDSASSRKEYANLFESISVSYDKELELAGNNRARLDALGSRAGYIAKAMNLFGGGVAPKQQGPAVDAGGIGGAVAGDLNGDGETSPDELKVYNAELIMKDVKDGKPVPDLAREEAEAVLKQYKGRVAQRAGMA